MLNGLSPSEYLPSYRKYYSHNIIRDILKMMPFGAGRRICPGLGVAMQNLEYLVANLVWRFEWTPANGKNVDISEKIGLTIDLKNLLRAYISPRVH
ncbi:hypothetical protein ACOSQ2_028160 [Xanthoceras sorbifolium]